MKTFIQGQVTGQDNKGLPYYRVELWEIDQKGKVAGNKPVLQTLSQPNGFFYIDTRLLSTQKKFPVKGVFILRNYEGTEIEQQSLTQDILEGEWLNFEVPKAPQIKSLDIWPTSYIPTKQIPDSLINKLESSSHLIPPVIENINKASYYNTYIYLPPLPNVWPWPVDPENIPAVDDLQQPFLLGAQFIYKQEWQLLGYATGELLHSLPLAPGEETTIEVLSWDRNIYKREDEISSDIEREAETNRQYKDSRDILREVQSTKKWKVGGNFGLNLGFVKFGGGGGTDNQSQNLNRNTRSTIVESTEKAATKVHDQRKTLISSSREYGSEEKITRKLTNTNRCHTVTYHFYEVLSNYRILTSPASPAARPCIFVRQRNYPIEREILIASPYDYDKFKKALVWLNLNRHIIGHSLLDRSFFEALELIPSLVAYWTIHRGVAAADINPDPILEPHVRSLIKKADILQNFILYSQDPFVVLLGFTITYWAPEIFQIILSANDSLKSRFDRYIQHDQTENSLKVIVEDFIKSWNEIYNSPSPNLGVIRGLLESDMNRKLLYDDILLLQKKYTEWVYGPVPGYEATEEELHRMENVTEVMRLMHHIYENYLYYFQNIWASKDIEQILLEMSSVRLPSSLTEGIKLSDVISPEIIGFYGDYIVFPFTKAYEGTEVANLVNGFLKLEATPTISEVALPTNGIVVEPQLGEYSACEAFIQEHREKDLRQKDLELERYHIENLRRSKKIDNCQLENPECCPSPKYGFFSRLLCKKNN